MENAAVEWMAATSVLAGVVAGERSAEISGSPEVGSRAGSVLEVDHGRMADNKVP